MEDNTVHFQATFTHLIQGEPWICQWEGSVHLSMFNFGDFFEVLSLKLLLLILMFSFGILKNQLPPHHLGS